MKTINFPTSACRVCRFYRPEGRRGGTCQQLSVPVSASWKACSLALPPFAPSWEQKIEEIWPKDERRLKEALCVNYSIDDAQPDLSEEKSRSLPKKLKADMVLV